MKTKPRAGERFSEYLTRYAHELLLRAGASQNEAADYSEIMACVSGSGVLTATIEDARTLLADWREERRMVAANIRRDRVARLAAGYRGLPVGAPVMLNGVTEW